MKTSESFLYPVHPANPVFQFSLTPCFSAVPCGAPVWNRFSGFPRWKNR
jgi:hypothetical protein